MTNEVIAIQNIQQNVNKLIKSNNTLRGKHLNLLEENKDLKLDLKDKTKEIVKLKEQLATLKVAKSLITQGEKSLEIKLKINELVREVDKCLAQLNR